LAKSQLNSAVRAPPIWRKPVGEGAKRTVTVIAARFSTSGRRGHSATLAIAVSATGVHPLPL
jgi:hypothetical protein